MASGSAPKRARQEASTPLRAICAFVLLVFNRCSNGRSLPRAAPNSRLGTHHAVFDEPSADSVDRAERRSVPGPLAGSLVPSSRWVWLAKLFLSLTTSYQRVIMGRDSYSKLGPRQAVSETPIFASSTRPVFTVRTKISNRK